MSLLPTSTLNRVNSLTSTLGLNQWQIQDASWNGYKFSSVPNNVLSTNSSGLGAISTAIGATAAVVDSTLQAIGYGLDNTSRVPSGANMQLQNSADSFNRKVAINSLPNGKDNIRGLGYNGQDIVLYGFVWGTNYMNGMKNNLINMFYSDQVVSPSNKNYHVLEHPFFGRIANVWLLNMRIVHQATYWRSCIYELRFKSEEPIGLQKTTRSISQIINDSISGVLTVASSINNLWSSYTNVFNVSGQLKQFKNNAVVQNKTQTMRTAILASTNNSIIVTQTLTQTLAPLGYNNVGLNTFPTTTASIPQLSYFKSHFTPQDVRNMIDVLTNNINIAINEVYQYGNNYYYDTIAGLQKLISNVSEYAILLLEEFYGQIFIYTVPYNMDLFTACNINGIDYEQSFQNILALNQNKIIWLNKLVKGDKLIMPLSNTQ